MNTIIPVADLWNRFAEMPKTVCETGWPDFLTRTGTAANRVAGFYRVQC